MMVRSDEFMATGPLTNPRLARLTNLKQVFEAAVQDLDDPKTNPAKQPIYPRKQAAIAQTEPGQKRALEEAAEALAALWKTSSKSVIRRNESR
jgi:hypothetical protein